MSERSNAEYSREQEWNSSGGARASTSTGPSRRAFLATGAAVTVGSLVGCLGGGSESSEGPEPPWTTEQLAKQVDDGAEMTLYSGGGDSQSWYDLTEVINDEFDTNLTVNVVASDAASISQRFLQERQAKEDKVDLLATAGGLHDRIQSKGEEEGLDLAREWFEWDVDKNFWFTDVLPDRRVMKFGAAGANGGAGICMPVSEQIFEEKGLDYPTTYNDLFDEQYDGLTAAFSTSYVSPGMIGWITRYHANQTDMDNTEWITSLMDRFEIMGVNSHSAGTREVGKGNAAMMLYNWPWAAAPFVKNPDLNVEGVFTDPVKSDALGLPMTINKKAPKPWLARYFVSAMLEKPVQRRMPNEVNDQIPVRTDIDLSGLDIHQFTKERLNANLDTIGYWESEKYPRTGQQAVDAGIFEP